LRLGAVVQIPLDPGAVRRPTASTASCRGSAGRATRSAGSARGSRQKHRGEQEMRPDRARAGVPGEQWKTGAEHRQGEQRPRMLRGQ
jgi:hypothetical protein